MNVDFSKIDKVHFIGIGGIGVSAIARMMLHEGKKVSGSDRSASDITSELQKSGARVFIGQKAENIDSATGLVIYTVAIPEDNPELLEARELGIPSITYPEALGKLSEGKFTIAVSGAHGKTTTTAMIAAMLIDAGFDPTVIVGSILKDQQSNFIAGKSNYLVIEACEYKRSFLNYTPTILVITNIDDDHLDYYKDMEDIKSAFRELVNKVPSTGAVVCDREQMHIEDVVKKATCDIVDYELFGDQNLKLKVPGSHNLANAAAVLAVADILKIPRDRAKKSLQRFSGTWRRFEYKGKTKKGSLVYDDYGHHPTEVEATIQGARELYPEAKVTVIFQPHLYSRTKQHLHEFGKAFGQASNVVLAPIYAAREAFDGSITSDNGGNAVSLGDFEAIEKHIVDGSEKGDVVIVMGAGDITELGGRLAVIKE
jgi:UDP-N-acetylmuramate--alanine ligase